MQGSGDEPLQCSESPDQRLSTYLYASDIGGVWLFRFRPLLFISRHCHTQALQNPDHVSNALPIATDLLVQSIIVQLLPVFSCLAVCAAKKGLGSSCRLGRRERTAWSRKAGRIDRCSKHPFRHRFGDGLLLVVRSDQGDQPSRLRTLKGRARAESASCSY